MSLPNYPNSHQDVVSTATHVLEVFERSITDEMPGINIIYDEQLSYETGMKALIAKYNYNKNENKNLKNPVFIYNRTVMRNVLDGVAQRLNNFTSTLRLASGETVSYTATSSEFDIQFLFATKDIETQERFEVAYQSEEGITGNKELIVKCGDKVGDFKYFLKWGELTEKTIEFEDLYFKGIIGSLVVRGLFFVFRGKASVIESLRLRIYLTNKLNEPQQLILEEVID